ncbi:MAG: hypothetical protein H6577_23235 [Lewinellaceae bacterium]|nr:hypothetical protein [Saprospiraceae bacterium]MCB9341051.1 hypothetical protein [Lewinellaceae bacterium]
MQEELFDKALDWAKKHGFSDLKANHGDFESPAHFNRPGEDDPVVPDITGLRTGGKSYIEIAVKSEEVNKKVSKWKLLSTLAARKGGKLFLLTPRGHKRFAEDIVREHNLMAEIRSI